MGFEFSWDPRKSRANLRKHRVSFEEASTVFDDPLSSVIADPDHSLGEARLLIFGMSRLGRVLAVMFAERAARIRIISARIATRRERDAYEQEDP